MPSYTYLFENEASVTIDTAATPTPVAGEPGQSGYAITSISGTWEGEPIVGEIGSGGSVQSSGGFTWDNTLFASDAGGAGGSMAGIDEHGILFAIGSQPVHVFTTDGQAYYNQGDTILANSIVSVSVACFCSGTLIATERGEAAVETLAVGDRVITAGGGAAPVRWIGQRTLQPQDHPCPERVRPVCVRAGALGEGLPRRDLWLSPGHALAMDGVLIQAERLVNGTTIVQEGAQADGRAVTYWHVELERHDVLLAEGAPAESYLDTGNRSDFEDGGAFVALHPDFRPKHWAETCLPLIQDGPVLQAAKARLLALATDLFGYTTTQETQLRLLADGIVVTPWASDSGCYRFQVPAGSRELRLVSRAWVPSQLLSASTDTRTLGVCVRRLAVDGRAVSLGDARLASGWAELERDGAEALRWTTGSALLPAGAEEVDVWLDGFVSYWQHPAPDPLAAIAA